MPLFTHSPTQGITHLKRKHKETILAHMIGWLNLFFRNNNLFLEKSMYNYNLF